MINNEGFSGLNVVSTLNAVAKVTTRKPAGGLTYIQKSAATQKIRKEISVPLRSSISSQLNLDKAGI